MLFETALGRCGIAWGDRGILAVQLPEATDERTRARLRRRAPTVEPTAPPADVARVAAGIAALLRGEHADLTGAVLDMQGIPEFDAAVYAVVRAIPAGATLTYGEVARRVGEPGGARPVGRALGRNPFATIVPCHRVVAAGGGLGGFSAAGGAATKRRLLAIEGGGPDAGTGDLFRHAAMRAGPWMRAGP